MNTADTFYYCSQRDIDSVFGLCFLSSSSLQYRRNIRYRPISLIYTTVTSALYQKYMDCYINHLGITPETGM